MSAMVTISSVMALGYLNVMFCLMVWQLSDNMDKWFDQYEKRKSKSTNKEGV